MATQEEICGYVHDPLYSRLGKNAIMHAQKQLLSTPSKYPSGRHTRQFTIITASTSKKPRGKQKQLLGSSFCAVTREDREKALSDNAQKPCVGQYSPNHAAIKKQEYSPYIRNNELPISLNGRKCFTNDGSPKKKLRICGRLIRVLNKGAGNSKHKKNAKSLSYDVNYYLNTHHILTGENFTCEPNEVLHGLSVHIPTIDFSKTLDRKVNDTSLNDSQFDVTNGFPNIYSKTRHFPDYSLNKLTPRKNLFRTVDLPGHYNASKEAVLSKTAYSVKFGSCTGRSMRNSIYKETGWNDSDISDGSTCGYKNLAHVKRVPGFDMRKMSPRNSRMYQANTTSEQIDDLFLRSIMRSIDY